jgi:hypothetical protein
MHGGHAMHGLVGAPQASKRIEGRITEANPRSGFASAPWARLAGAGLFQARRFASGKPPETNPQVVTSAFSRHSLYPFFYLFDFFYFFDSAVIFFRKARNQPSVGKKTRILENYVYAKLSNFKLY